MPSLGTTSDLQASANATQFTSPAECLCRPATSPSNAQGVLPLLTNLNNHLQSFTPVLTTLDKAIADALVEIQAVTQYFADVCPVPAPSLLCT